MTAAYADATASSSHKLCNIFVIICYLFAFITGARIVYDKNILINIRKGSVGIGLSAADLETITRPDQPDQAPPKAVWSPQKERGES